MLLIGNGQMDIAWANKDGTVSARMNVADDASFTTDIIAAASTATILRSIDFYDINFDGKPDMLLAYSDGAVSAYTQSSTVQPINGLGRFDLTVFQEEVAGSEQRLAWFSDVDNDGDIDVVTQSDGQGVLIFSNNCCGQLSTSTPTSNPNQEVCLPSWSFNVDASDATVSGSWTLVSDSLAHNQDYYVAAAGSSNTYVEYLLTNFPAGYYTFDASYVASSSNTEAADFKVFEDGLTLSQTVLDQTVATSASDIFVPLSLPPLKVEQGKTYTLRLAASSSTSGQVVADAIRIWNCDLLSSTSTATSTSTSSSTSTSTSYALFFSISLLHTDHVHSLEQARRQMHLQNCMSLFCCCPTFAHRHHTELEALPSLLK